MAAPQQAQTSPKFTAMRPVTIGGRSFGRGEAVPPEVLARVPDIAKLISARIVRAETPIDVEKIPRGPRAPSATPILPTDTPAERQAARKVLAEVEGMIASIKAEQRTPPVDLVNTAAAYRSVFADIARTTRHPDQDVGTIGVSPELLEAMDAEAVKAEPGEPALEALPEGEIPTAEDGNTEDEAGSATATIDLPPPAPAAGRTDASTSTPTPGGRGRTTGRGRAS